MVNEDAETSLELFLPQFGLNGFRPGQREVIAAVLAGYDCLCVMPTGGGKKQLLLDYLERQPGAGIIYASLRKRTEQVAELIAQRAARRAVAYHAGLLPDQRRRAQEAFMSGRVNVVVATNAFGMGIDKPDVRFVLHYILAACRFCAFVGWTFLSVFAMTGSKAHPTEMRSFSPRRV